MSKLVFENNLRSTLEDFLSQQLCEFELLSSMYPNEGDLVVTDKNIIVDVNNFLHNKTEYLPNHLDFTLNLHISDCKLEMCVTLPTHYPNEEPDIYLRCNQLNRQQETKLNADLLEYVKSIHVGEVCLYTVITWLQDNIDSYKLLLEDEENKNKSSQDTNIKIKANYKCCRLWIFSHHIYNKKKREDLMKKAKELKLTGFCLPGKPGVICIEGEFDACQDWWRDIRSMTWKKIMIRETEIFESLELNKKFSSFEELHFKNNTSSNRSNMSEFSRYMNEHGCIQIFNDFFGLCN